jgi:hypothetical protein
MCKCLSAFLQIISFFMKFLAAYQLVTGTRCLRLCYRLDGFLRSHSTPPLQI